ncbi:THUMP domain-containing protein [Sulfurisphaera javensis]|uniref:THUMP domain-containing protein n=1 Tax=Sulfurisphaera javensis TaxID=2049879 RepID=A0AAT9GRP1_9CREN
MEEPKLILTVKNNKNNKCIIEILNRLFLKDINSRAEEVVKNVILVYTSLSPIIAYGLIISAPPSCVSKIYPIDFSVNTINEQDIITYFVKYIKEKNGTFKTFYVDCYDRGVKVNCREIEIGIGIGLKDLAKVNFEKPDKVIVVNVVKDSAYLSIINKGQEKVSVNSLR